MLCQIHSSDKDALMDQDFEKAFVFTVGVEGIVSNDPNDSGGYTIYGISSRSYPDMVAKLKVLIDSNQKIAALQIAKQFYYDEFWQPLFCELLPYPVNAFYFDSAINEGGLTALSHLQKACHWYLGSPALSISTDTVQSISGFLRNEQIELFLLLACTARTDYYLNIVNINENNHVFLHGWLNRVKRFRKNFMTILYE